MQPLLGKVWGLLLYARVAHWAETQGVLSHCQFGFRHGRSTEQAIFTLTAMLGHYRHTRKKPTYAGFVDLKKAYDMVDREALLTKLRAMGAGDAFVSLAALSFEGTTARVWMNGDASEPFAMERGVAQGDPLSPILFALFIDDLLRELDESVAAAGLYTGRSGRPLTARTKIVCLAYADDIVLLADTAASLQSALDIVAGWAHDWGMRVNTNPGKTDVMIIPALGQPAPPPPEGGWVVDGVALNVTMTYDYLGYIVTPSLDTERTLRRRLGRAWWAAQQARALPRGLASRDLDVYIRSLVVPHLQYAAAVWAPQTPDEGGLYAGYAPTRPKDNTVPGTRCPFKLAEELHRELATYLLRRTVGHRPGRLNMPTALLYAEAGWTPLAAQWDAARLRLLGDIAGADDGSPLAAAGAVLADDYASSVASGSSHASRQWNWATQTETLLTRVDRDAGADEQLRQHLNMRTMRPAGAALTPKWRALVRTAMRGPGGHLEREWRARVGKDFGADGPHTATTVRRAADAHPAAPLPTYFAPGTAPAVALDGPRQSNRHATAAYMATLTHGHIAAEFGRHAMPTYRLHRVSKRSVETKRLELRTGTRQYGGGAVATADAPSGNGGLLWGVAVCPTCPGGVTADAAHFISDCPRHDALRRACLAAASARAKAGPLGQRRLHECFDDVAASLHTRAARSFVLLATLGATIADAQEQKALPVNWAECLQAPRRMRDGGYDIGFAARITFRAFEPLVVAVAAALPPAAAPLPVAPAPADAVMSGVAGAEAAVTGASPSAVALPQALVPAAAQEGALGLGLGAIPALAAPPLAPPVAKDRSVAAVAARLAARHRPASAAPAAAGAAPVAAAIAAPPFVVSIEIDVPRPTDVAAREDREDEDFGLKDPRRFNFRRTWSDGDSDVVAADHVDNWDSIEFRAFVWDNADGRGRELFELIGTHDLVSQFDPTV